MSIVQNAARRCGVRHISTSGARSAAAPAQEVAKGYHGIKKIQERFQVKDGKPVHLKGGAVDAMLYRATMALSLVGVGGILKLIYDLSWPKPAE